MAVELATAYVSLVASGKGITASIERELGGPLQDAAAKSGEQAGKTWGDRFSKHADKLEDFGRKGLIASTVLAGGLIAATSAAGSLEAAISANEQVLGSASKATQDFAKTSVESVGLSERAALEATTSFGQLAKIAGETGNGIADFSIKLVTLAADMAAFKDVSPTQSLADLQSAFAGQTEVLRKYNIFLDDASIKTGYFNETGERVTGTLTAQQRVIGTQNAIMAQSVDIQGQAARESEGLARQTANAKAELENMGASIGSALLPTMSKLVGFAGDVVRKFGEVNDATGGMVGGFLAIGTVGLGVASGLSTIIGKASKVSDTFTALSSTTKTTLGVLGGIAAVAGIAFAGYQAFTSGQREITKRAGEVSDALASQITATIESGTAAERAALGLSTLGTVLTGTGDDGKKLSESLTLLGVSGQDAVDVLLQMKDDPVAALRSLGEEAGLSGERLDDLVEFVNRTDAAFDKIGDVGDSPLGNLSGKIREAAIAADGSADSITQIALAMEEVQDQAEKTDIDKTLRPAILAIAAASGDAGLKMLELAEAQTGIQRTGTGLLPLYETFTTMLAGTATEADTAAQALDGTSLSTAGAAATMDIFRTAAHDAWPEMTLFSDAANTYQVNAGLAAAATDRMTTAYETLLGKIDDRQAWLNLQDAVDEYNFKTQSGTLSMREQEQANLALQDTLARYAIGLDEIPESIRTDVLAQIDRGEFDRATALLDVLTQERVVNIRGNLVGTSIRALQEDRIPGAATGTDYWRGGLLRVGERGEELVNLPRGSQVFDHEETQRITRNSMRSLGDLQLRDDAGYRGPLFGDVHVHEEVDADAVFRLANFHLASAVH